MYFLTIYVRIFIDYRVFHSIMSNATYIFETLHVLQIGRHPQALFHLSLIQLPQHK